MMLISMEPEPHQKAVKICSCCAQAAYWAVCRVPVMPAKHVLPASLCPCMQAAGKEQEFQALLSQTESAKLGGGALDTACTALQELISSVGLKDKVLQQACGHAFPHLAPRPPCGCSRCRASGSEACLGGVLTQDKHTHGSLNQRLQI